MSEQLETLLEASKTPDGRRRLASPTLVPNLLSDLPLSPSPLLPLRLLRNLCAGETLHQTSFLRSSGVNTVTSLVLCPGVPVRTVLVGLQVLANVAVAGDEHRGAVWGRMWRDGFGEVVGVRHEKVCDVVCMILYTCCRGDFEGNEGRRREMRGEAGLGIVREVVKCASSVGYRGDWLQFLVTLVCLEESLFSRLYLSLSTEQRKDDITGFAPSTSEQAFLLDLISEMFREQHYRGIISDEFLFGIFQTLKDSYSVVDFTSRCVSPLPVGVPAVDTLGFTLNILRDICALEHCTTETQDHIVDFLSSMSLVKLLLTMLRDLEPPSIIRKSYTQGTDKGVPSPNAKSFNFCPYKGFRRDIVAVVGNCLCKRKHIQDEIRRLDGILLLLQQCVTDDESPFLREWGIWMLRNLLDGNPENQKTVAELELQCPVSTPEISELGLGVEVDQKTRRPKLVNLR